VSKPGEPEPVPTIVDALLSSEILDKDAQAAIIVVLNELDRDRSSVTSALRRTSLATRLLPSLTDLNCVVDIRVGFDNDEIALAVPVVLVHIDTDSKDQEIWFKCRKGSLRRRSRILRRPCCGLRLQKSGLRGKLCDYYWL
jgi:hypothetical protein